jgi:N-acetylneuraminic acid mutarotase
MGAPDPQTLEMSMNRSKKPAVRTLAAAVVTLSLTLAVPATAAQAHPGHPPATGVPTDPGDAQYGDGWKQLASIAGGPRQEHGVAALDGDVYVVGGIRPDGSGSMTTVPDVEVYDPTRNSWEQAAPLPVAMNHPNLAVVGGRLYVLGGLSGGASWEALRDSFVYDPAADRWRELPPVPRGTERGSSAIGVRGSTVYLAGGMRTLTPGPGGLQDTVDLVQSYDVVTGRWRTLPSLPEARDHVGGAVVGNVLYVVGGRDRGQVNVRDSVFALNLSTHRWSTRAPMPTARGGIATAVVGSTIYTFGGEGNTDDSTSVFDQVEAYDTSRNRWTALAPMPVPRHGTAATSIDGTVYIPGGGDHGGGSPMDVNDAFRPRPR